MKAGDYQFDWPLIGNEHITEYLAKNIAKETIAGVYIFCGPEHLGKTTIAYHFAQILLCAGSAKQSKMPCGECHACLKFNRQDIDAGGEKNKEAADERAANSIAHGDFHVLFEEEDKKNISIEQAREFIRKLSMSSFLNSYKVGVIKNAHLLSDKAANALLKTLEEPKDKVVIILITPNVDILPATIVSRSRVVRFNPVKTELIYDYLIDKFKASRSAAQNFSRLCLGRPALAAKFFEDKDFLNDYLKKADIFLNSVAGGDNLKTVGELLGAKTAGQEAVSVARAAVEIWQGLVRDLILFNYNQDNLARNHLLEKGLDKVKSKFNIRKLLDLAEILRRAGIYLNANVSPKTVLEQIMINVN